MHKIITESGAIVCRLSGNFADWLSASLGCIVFSTYQAGKLGVLAWDGQRVVLLLRHFDKPLGLAVDATRLALATRNDVTLFADAPLLAASYQEANPGKYDRLYLPRVSYHTGDLNTHDIAFAGDALWLVNTRFSCLCTLSDTYCFEPRWRPPFITELAPEDRCHLNGVAIVNEAPRYVTALGMTDAPGAWRAQKAVGGCLLEVPSGMILLLGLSMPHSPRWHRDAIWFLNSGKGLLCRYVPGAKDYDVVCELPAYLRGLRIIGEYALVGMSMIREKHIFGGLPVQEAHGDRLRCGIAVVDLTNGREIGCCEFTSGCTELFEVNFLARTRRPMIVNLEQAEARQAFPVRDFSYWLRPSSLIMDDAGIVES